MTDYLNLAAANLLFQRLPLGLGQDAEIFFLAYLHSLVIDFDHRTAVMALAQTYDFHIFASSLNIIAYFCGVSYCSFNYCGIIEFQ